MTHTPTIRFILDHPAAQLPAYAHAGDAGADVCAAMDQAIKIYPGGRVVIPTGLRADIPAGYEIQVRPRSGLAAKHGITVLNAPGTVDSGYKGEIGIVLHNSDEFDPYTVMPGDKVAQFVIARHETVSFERADDVGESSRGEGGFGSTGVAS